MTAVSTPILCTKYRTRFLNFWDRSQPTTLSISWLCPYNEAPFCATIRKSSTFFPSFNEPVSHRGFFPRPLHVSPFGDRYFGLAFLRCAVGASRLSSRRKSSARLLSNTAISSRNVQRASLERVVRESFFGDMTIPQRAAIKIGMAELTVL